MPKSNNLSHYSQLSMQSYNFSSKIPTKTQNKKHLLHAVMARRRYYLFSLRIKSGYFFLEDFFSGALRRMRST